MLIEQKNAFIKIGNSLIRISKIDFVKTRHIVKANNFGKVSDESTREVIISMGPEKHVFAFETEEEQTQAFNLIENILTDKD